MLNATKTGLSSLEPVQRLLDASVIVLGGLAAHALRFGALPPNDGYGILLLLGALLSLLIFPLFNFYRSWRGTMLLELAGRLIAAWAVVFVTLALLLFTFKIGDEYSRTWFYLWGGLAGAGLVLSRLAVYAVLHLVRRRGLNLKRVAIVGTGPVACELVRRTEDSPWAGFKVVARFSPQGSRTEDSSLPLGALPNSIRTLGLDELWIALPLRDEAVIQDILHELRHETINVRFSPDISSLRLINHHVSTLLGMPVLNLRTSPMSGTNRLVKEMEDRCLALLFLVMASPLMMLIAFGVKLTSPGPVLFKQRRHGWDGKEIYVYKFRSMTVQASADDEVRQARRDDPRTTPFGAFLRRTSLDELPQLFNVLRGHMSLVGPRPHAIQHNEFYKEKIDSYMLRHKVKPGMTGWAQVNGFRGETDTLEKMRKRVEYDLYYIEHWSLWFDLKILLLTLFKGFMGKNAY